MKTEITRNENEVVVLLSGRLDTPAAQEIAPQMNELAAEADRTIILDCSDLSYISSSGLRIFLSLRKASLGIDGLKFFIVQFRSADLPDPAEGRRRERRPDHRPPDQ